MEEDTATASTTRHGRKHAREETQQGGYYADPMSPIASTPMKRPRTKPSNTKSAKAKRIGANTSSRSNAQQEEDKRFFSPRKLSKEYDDDVADADGEATQVGKSTKEEASKRSKKKGPHGDGDAVTPVTVHSTQSKERETAEEEVTRSGNDDGDVDGAMFSPALKIPRTSVRSPNSSNGSQTATPTGARVRLDAAFALVESDGSPDEDKADAAAAVLCEETSVASEDADSASDGSGETEFNPFVFIKSLPAYDEIVPNGRTVVLPATSKHTPKICLVLDLDETLVHCTVEHVENPHLQFPVNFNGVDYMVNVKKRPHMEYFLKQVATQFEVVVFTASHRAYAEKLLNLIDPRRELIKYRLYRDDCLDVYGNYIKDLNVLGRQLSKVVLVDNSPHAFGYQVNNGIPIETWYDDEADEELLNLLPFLESLNQAEDVRPVVEKQFQIQKLIDSLPDEPY